MKKFYLFFTVALFSNLYNLPGECNRINLELLITDESYRAVIGPKFRELKELQIGGTHTYGNKASIKSGEGKGKLDPTILIVNPDPAAHDQNDSSILSIVGSGFDRSLLEKVEHACRLLDHRFTRVYINNVTTCLPVADDASDELAAPQMKSLDQSKVGESVSMAFNDGVEIAFMKYYKKVYELYLKLVSEGKAPLPADMDEQYFFTSKKHILEVKEGDLPSIYHYYLSLLKKDGRLVIKFAQTYHPLITFLKSFLNSTSFTTNKGEHQKCYTLDKVGFEKDREHPDKYIKLTNKRDQDLYNNIKAKLQKTGDRCIVHRNEYVSNTAFSATDSRSLIYSEIGFLESLGFKDVVVFFGQFENHGYYGLFDEPYLNAYSLVIDATKGNRF